MSAIATPSSQINADRPSPSLRSLVAMENLKLRKRPMAWVIFALITLLVSAGMVIGYLGSRSQSLASGETLEDQLSSFLLPSAITNAFAIVAGFGSILVVVLAASSVGSEYGWGTVRVLVGSGVSRVRLLAAKVISLAEVTALLILAGVGAMTLSSLILTIVGGHELSFGWLDGEASIDILLMFVRTWFVLFVSVALAFALAVVTRSLAAAIALGIGFGIIEGILASVLGALGDTGETISEFLLSPNINAISRLNGFDGREVGSVEGAVDPWRAAALLTFYIVALLGIAFAVFRRRDIASGG